MGYHDGVSQQEPVSRRTEAGRPSTVVLSRSISTHASTFKLADGRTFSSRRYLPIGKGDVVSLCDDSLTAYVSRDRLWIDHTAPWTETSRLQLGALDLLVTFKEIETAEEQELFQQLRQFHYRGGGGAGRTVPIIGTVEAPDLPRVVGFIELSSSMIANSARKRFFAAPYSEPSGIYWRDWDRLTSRKYSNLICRISRFVIHPELRGLGLASLFAEAARKYAGERWNYGGYRPRFLEITADMLRFYPFVGRQFTYMGDTEGNEHRVSKDMNYLVRKAMSAKGLRGMPQGGGGIMSLQRSYAAKLLEFISDTGFSLEETVGRLQYDPALLDQESWEALHNLNRRPKPCYVTGLTQAAEAYVSARASTLHGTRGPNSSRLPSEPKIWRLDDINITVSSGILQTSEARTLQDAFGFVGASVSSTVVEGLSLSLRAGEMTLVCGASGSGKSLLLGAVEQLLTGAPRCERFLTISGSASGVARVTSLPTLDPNLTPLDYLRDGQLPSFLAVTARCGLAEPQLLVRPIWTLSSGQRYRLQVALAVLVKPQIILIDNFCESLDRFSARAVCKGLRSLVLEHNVACVLATAAYDRLANFIAPGCVVMLRRGDRPTMREGVLGEI
ncbi:ATP-binding cassette domain-containing protein [Allosphingosinicella indica]|uniref:ABC transporter n=1 Tax=Allosphingosinicella indica TaxID=941907 RepID=A0A1X7G468_9SPHN|nr:ATP-binding cassette domain-containing protein [Allosphingosinicella indica]SMF63557.1 ABC transporter [Allosphingosinicella indica]